MRTISITSVDLQEEGALNTSMEKQHRIDPMDEYFLDPQGTCDYLADVLRHDLRAAGYLAETLHLFPSDDPDFLHLVCHKNNGDTTLRTLAVLPARKNGLPASSFARQKSDQRGRLMISYRVEALCAEIEYLLKKERDFKNRTALTRAVDALKDTLGQWWKNHMA